MFSFFFRAHFNYEEPEKGEMAFRKSDVFHVVDTLHNGVVGSWQVFRMGESAKVDLEVKIKYYDLVKHFNFPTMIMYKLHSLCFLKDFLEI